MQDREVINIRINGANNGGLLAACMASSKAVKKVPG